MDHPCITGSALRIITGFSVILITRTARANSLQKMNESTRIHTYQHVKEIRGIFYGKKIFTTLCGGQQVYRV